MGQGVIPAETAATPNVNRVELYFSRGTSNKIYIVKMEPSQEGFLVNFEYGRIGATLQHGTKTSKGLPKAEAWKLFEKLVNEKIAKGYTLKNDDTTMDNVADTGIYCQLLNPIEDVEPFLKDGAWVAQQKFDGKRILLKIENGKAIGINRRGLVCPIPESLTKGVEELAQENGDTVLDGELIGEVYYAFDILMSKEKDIRELAYEERLIHLYNLITANRGAKVVHSPQTIKAVTTALSEEGKRSLLLDLQKQGLEGIVFKRRDAPYGAGRPHSGGPQLKFKFQEETTCLVKEVNPTKRSVSLSLRGDDGAVVDVGNCAIPVNKDIPNPGDCVDVRYLYAYKGGSLYQPFYKGVRDDKETADLYSTLKFK